MKALVSDAAGKTDRAVVCHLVRDPQVSETGLLALHSSR